MTHAPTKWLRIRQPATCPVCQHKRASGCSISDDGAAVVCIRVESTKPMPGNGMGWLHKLSDPLPPPPARKAKPAPPPVRDWAAAVKSWCDAASDHDVLQFSDGIGVTYGSLRALNVGWDGEAWTFPMRDAQGTIVGVRRRFLGGKKLSVAGGHEGCFYPPNVIGDQTERVYVCEGPTDCAALLSVGVAAIGRPSALGGVEILKTMLRIKRLDVVVVADNDKPDAKGNRVGMQGAERLANELVWIGQRVVKVIAPLKGKDVREWKPSLATLNRCVAMAPVWIKREK